MAEAKTPSAIAVLYETMSFYSFAVRNGFIQFENTPLGQVFIHLPHPMQASAFSNITCLCKKKPVLPITCFGHFPHIPNMPCISVGSLRHTQLLFFSLPLFFCKFKWFGTKEYGQNKAILGLFKVSCPECTWAYTCRLCKYT